MDYREWQLKRRDLQAREIAERSGNLESARAPLQVAITEQAIRELYDMVNALRAQLAKADGVSVVTLPHPIKRGPGRPPKNEAE